MASEHDSRVYYQNLVYKACNLFDELLANTDTHNNRVVCGTADAPTTGFQEAIEAIRTKWLARETLLKDYQDEFQARQMDDVATSNISVIRDIHEKTLRAISGMCQESLAAHPHYPETYPSKLAILEKAKDIAKPDNAG